MASCHITRPTKAAAPHPNPDTLKTAVNLPRWMGDGLKEKRIMAGVLAIRFYLKAKL